MQVKSDLELTQHKNLEQKTKYLEEIENKDSIIQDKESIISKTKNGHLTHYRNPIRKILE